MNSEDFKVAFERVKARYVPAPPVQSQSTVAETPPATTPATLPAGQSQRTGPADAKVDPDVPPTEQIDGWIMDGFTNSKIEDMLQRICLTSEIF